MENGLISGKRKKEGFLFTLSATDENGARLWVPESVFSEDKKVLSLQNEILRGNLEMVDSLMPDMLEWAFAQLGDKRSFSAEELSAKLIEGNPMGYRREGFYRFKIGELLWAFACGMNDHEAWDGRDRTLELIRPAGTAAPVQLLRRRERLKEELLRLVCISLLPGQII